MYKVSEMESQKLFVNMEKAFNLAGYVLRSSGAYRGMMGQLQVIGGLASCAINSVRNLYQGKRGLAALDTTHLMYCRHGAANIARGSLESFAWYTGLGLFPIIYDLAQMRMKYVVENKQQASSFFPTLGMMNRRIQQIPTFAKDVWNTANSYMSNKSPVSSDTHVAG